MGVVERARHRAHDLGRLARLEQPRSLEPVRERLALDQVHDEVRAARGLADLVHGHHVGVPEPGRGPGLDLEPLAVRPALVRPGTEDLDRDLAPLADATSLLYLNVSDNELESVSGLSTLDNLAMLNVSYNQLTSAAQFSSMTRLIELNLSSNAITTLEPLVEAQTFGKQGSLWIGGNSLPCASQQEHIDALEARGMTVYGACEN